MSFMVSEIKVIVPGYPRVGNPQNHIARRAILHPPS
ncbi:MAG: hypothetical protein HW419_3635, partial [Deltaproteobacteria bacterium]|nr:hypothetical protein [Deltaproteobacteria bacterium]